MRRILVQSVALGILALAASGVVAQEGGPPRPQFQPDGSVKVPAFTLPPSSYLSPEALEALKGQARPAAGARAPDMTKGIAGVRQMMENQLSGWVNAQKARYPVTIVEEKIGGVRTRIITPRDGKFDPKRVLINLHGGAFSMCAEACAMLESIPVASVGRFKVITVDYRQGPEHVYPAASEDVEAVYRAVLKDFPASRIGIYGCSAGGALTAQVAAWLPSRGLPQAGAVGIMGAGGARFGTGDSAYVAGYAYGGFAPPPPPGVTPPKPADRSYFEGADMRDPLVSPALHLDTLRKYPPTFVLTGTRAADLSGAVFTHSQLLKAGVESELLVGEAMGHCYIYQTELPEARDAVDQIVKFFHKRLK